MKTSFGRSSMLVALLLVVTLLLTACGGAASSAAPAASGTAPAASGAASTAPAGDAAPAASGKDSLILGHAAYIESLDPLASGGDGNNALMQVFAYLMRIGPDGQPMPHLAESMDVSEDGLTMTFTLRDAKWSNGDPITADDVVFTMNRCKESSYAGANYVAVESFEAVDDKTVVFHMASSDRSMPFTLATSSAGIVHKATVEVADEAGDTSYFLNPVASGAFKVEEWIPGERITFTANENYYNYDQMAIKKTEWVPITDPNTMLIALQSGDVDYAGRYSIVVSSQQVVDDDPNLDATGSATAALIVLGFNNDKAPFDNADVRKAISHALNKEDIILMALEGRATAVGTCLPDIMSQYTEGVPTYDYNVETAKTLLADAGFADGFEMGLTITSAQTKEAEVVQAQLAEVGITVNVETVESSALPTILGEGSFDSYFRQVGLTYYDPNGIVEKLYHSVGMFNHSFYANPEVDDMITVAKSMWDEADITSSYNELLKMVAEDLPVIPLYYPEVSISYRKGLTIPYFGSMNMFYVDDFSWAE